MSIIRFDYFPLSSVPYELMNYIQRSKCFFLLGAIQLGELVKRIEQELEETKSTAKEKQLLYENCVNTVSLLEKSIKEHDNNREGRLKDLEKKIKTIKSQMQSSSKALKVGIDTAELYLKVLYNPEASTCYFSFILDGQLLLFHLLTKVIPQQ